MNIETIINQIQKETPINTDIVEHILSNSSEYSYLEFKTMKDISQEIYDSLFEFVDKEKYYKQLEEYRYVEKVCDLRLGTYTKCFTKKKEWKGGILIKIEVFEENISILCKNGAYFQRYSFNDSIVYQKLSLEEKMILVSYDYYKNKENQNNI